MGFVLELIADVLLTGFVLEFKKRGPWWLWILVAASPVLFIAMLFGLILFFNGWS